MKTGRPVTRIHRLPSGRVFFATVVPVVLENAAFAGVVVNERAITALQDSEDLPVLSEGTPKR